MAGAGDGSLPCAVPSCLAVTAFLLRSGMARSAIGSSVALPTPAVDLSRERSMPPIVRSLDSFEVGPCPGCYDATRRPRARPSEQGYRVASPNRRTL